MAKAAIAVKRFWRDVRVADGQILLDDRPVRTPLRARLRLPTDALAQAVADEWRAVGDIVNARDMPMTGLANAAIDRPPAAPSIAVYGETDLLCYRAEAPPELAAREAGVWDPMLAWARTRFGITFAVTAGIVHAPQSPATVQRLSAAVAAYADFPRTALSSLVAIGGSLVAALMVAERAIDAGAAFDACHVDELWQAELWGEDWMATDARDARRRDFIHAAKFLELVAQNPSG